jgi:hypothetical protein
MTRGLRRPWSSSPYAGEKSGIWLRDSGICVGPVKPRRFRGEQSQNRRGRHAQRQAS